MKIVQYLGGAGSWGDVTPETMNKKGLGGRETALIQLAENWAEMGHDVVNFVPTRLPSGTPGRCRYVNAPQVGSYLQNFGADVLVSWEEPRLMDDQFVENVGLAIIEMQVAHLDTKPEYDRNTDVYAVLSDWAGGFLAKQSEDIDERKLKVFPNGVNLRRFTEARAGYPIDARQDPSKYPWEFYYSSSPDRGLNHLLNCWPLLLDRFPNAVLHVAYGIEKWVGSTQWSHNMQSEAALDIAEGIKQDGVIYHGKIGQDELAQLQISCHALLYPCDPMSPTETGCITVVEAGAACSPAIITDADCLGAEFSDSAEVTRLPFDPDGYVATISDVMKDPDRYTALQNAGLELARERSWPLIAEMWDEMFKTADKRSYARAN